MLLYHRSQGDGRFTFSWRRPARRSHTAAGTDYSPMQFFNVPTAKPVINIK
jgi:hypothetical protein